MKQSMIVIKIYLGQEQSNDIDILNTALQKIGDDLVDLDYGIDIDIVKGQVRLDDGKRDED